MQTRDQLYAEDAFKRVMKIHKEQTESFGKSYGSMAHKLPVLIHTSGLVQALEFVNSRSTKDAHHSLLTDLSQTVVHKSTQEFLEQSRTDELRSYILLTEKVLAALLWYKRYAQSILNVQEGDEPDAEDESEKEAQK